MVPFKTTAEQLVELASYVIAMNESGLEPSFIAEAFELARTDQGAFDLVALWKDAETDKERGEIVADLQELFDDHREAPPAPQEKPYIAFDKLGGVVKSVRQHKKRLRELIDRNGGISEVARKSGIPQPSLSRMLSSGSMPRRTTLYRIATALGVPETDVLGEWIR